MNLQWTLSKEHSKYIKQGYRRIHQHRVVLQNQLFNQAYQDQEILGAPIFFINLPIKSISSICTTYERTIRYLNFISLFQQGNGYQVPSSNNKTYYNAFFFFKFLQHWTCAEKYNYTTQISRILYTTLG